MNASKSGLEGIVVAETRMSDVDGERGRLVLRGHPVEELAPSSTFEDACALFLDDRAHLGGARVRAYQRLVPIDTDDAMVALRAALALPGPDDPWDATAEVAVALAAWWRRRQGLPPIAPDASASHASDLLRMLGVAHGPREVRALDTYLVTVIDHGMNASTFAARVVASTGSDLRSCLVAGIGALKGPLHGGAPGPVLDMLDAIGTASNARAYLERELAAGRRIMGMGHRVYRVRDPRAFVLEGAVKALASPRIALGRVVEREAEALLAARHPERALKANVELFTALLLDALAIDRALFSGIFASSRVVGWCAHVGEQRHTGRLIRPASKYVG